MLIYSQSGLGLIWLKIDGLDSNKFCVQHNSRSCDYHKRKPSDINNNYLVHFNVKSKLQAFLNGEKAASNIRNLNKKRVQHKHYNSAHLK